MDELSLDDLMGGCTAVDVGGTTGEEQPAEDIDEVDIVIPLNKPTPAELAGEQPDGGQEPCLDVLVARVIARAMEGEFVNVTDSESGTIYRRTGQIFVPDDEHMFERGVIDCIEEGVAIRFERSGRYLNAPKLRGLLSIMRTLMSHRVDELDADNDTIAFKNGVLRFDRQAETVEFGPVEYDEYLTMQAGCNYAGSARPDALIRLLRHQGMSDEEIEYLQMALGAGLLRLSQKIFINIIGERDRGKTLFVNTLLAAFGSLATTLPADALTEDAARRATRDDLLRLRGRCLAVIDEMSSGRINASVGKSLTGDSEYVIRGTYKKPISLRYRGLLLNAANEPPMLSAGDGALDARFVVIPFTESVRGQPQEFYDDLKRPEQLSGLMTWVIEGGLKLLRRGGRLPEVPQRFQQAKRAAVDANSIVDEFITAHLTIDPTRRGNVDWRIPLTMFMDLLGVYARQQGMEERYIPAPRQIKAILRKRNVEVRDGATKYRIAVNEPSQVSKNVLTGVLFRPFEIENAAEEGDYIDDLPDADIYGYADTAAAYLTPDSSRPDF